MACVTLKRPLDFDPLEALHSPNRPPTKRRRCTPLKNVDRDSTTSLAQPSVFRESSLSPSEIANHLRDELKRLRKRRQIVEPYPTSSRSPPGSPEPMMADQVEAANRASPPVATIQAGPSSPRSAANMMAKSSRGDRPVFTLKQMTLICEKMCKERTDQVREEYDRILQQKLSEQYDAFVKFIDHQIQQRFNQSTLPSYLS
jgi:hypothetical protein